jgi:serine/threonine protein kinase
MTGNVTGFIFGTTLGEKATAFVSSAHHVHAPVKAAIKQISKKQRNVIISPIQIVHEVIFHSQINHPFLV